ncbi:MAG: ABC transporter ATP-binding protein [Magnetovibrionaceae bacterium]
MSLLVVEHLSKSYDGFRALEGVDFTLDPGSATAIIGPNGAGKSTCFNLLGGQIKPTEGRIRFDGQDITDLKPQAVARAGIGRTFQIASAFASMSVEENLRTALEIASGRSRMPWRRRQNVTASVDSLLDDVNLQALREQPVANLAYGDVKRLEIAIALASKPRLLLLDEPTAGMAKADRGPLMELIQVLRRRQNLTVLFTEHDMEIVFGTAERVIVLHRGQLVADGSPEAVRRNDTVREIYLGTRFGDQEVTDHAHR